MLHKKILYNKQKVVQKGLHFRGGDGILFNTHFIEKGEMV